MKKILVSISLVSLLISVTSAQGLINFNTGPNPTTRISTNSVIGGPAAGYTGNTPGIYYYALFASPVNTSINGNIFPFLKCAAIVLRRRALPTPQTHPTETP